MIDQGLDSLTCGAFFPYRDGEGRVRLLDLLPASKPSSKARKLYRQLAEAADAALRVADESTYRVWYVEHGEPAFVAVSSAMYEGDDRLGHEESQDLADLSAALLSAVHRPGWTAAAVRPLPAGTRVRGSLRTGIVVSSSGELARVRWDACKCSRCTGGKPCVTARMGDECEVHTCMIESMA